MTEKLLTLKETAKLLRVSKDAIAKFIGAEDPLPFMKAGRRYLFDPDKIFKWAERQGRRELRKQNEARKKFGETTLDAALTASVTTSLFREGGGCPMQPGQRRTS